jgi:formamidopyrimidine-DNA glycosylase
MPEMPEVETIRRGLSELLVGKEIKSIDVLKSKSLAIPEILLAKNAVGQKFTRTRRFGKLLALDITGGNTILIHLKMTGQLVYRGKSAGASSGEHFGGGHPTDSLIDALPDNSTRVIFNLDAGTLYFNDQRIFGKIDLVKTEDVPNVPFIKKLGPEPSETPSRFDIKEFESRANRHLRISIKALLLDQSSVAGIGNIYADETLWEVKVHPAKKVQDLKRAELSEIFKAAGKVMALSIEHGGSTDRNYINAKGERGAYLDFANVFRREGKPCHRCNTLIIKLRVAGRGTHICPNCQVE